MASTFGHGEIIVATEARKFVVKQLQIVEYTVTRSAYDGIADMVFDLGFYYNKCYLRRLN